MNEQTTLVSVIIPCYNVADFVERSIQSILNQTYQNLEIWIIDDASTDDTLAKIESFKDARIKIETFKENRQKVGAVNEVLKKIKGDYIAFQDGDDWSEPGRIELQLSEFQKDNELGICFTGYRYVGKRTSLPGKIALTDEALRNEVLNYTPKYPLAPTVCGTMMISRAALSSTIGYHPYFAGRVGEDIHWIYRILKGFKGITIDKPLYNYTSREGSLTQVQSTGIKPKYAYSWHLLSKIIYKDIHEGIDVLAPENADLLKKLELEACEESLEENIRLLNNTRKIYENSMNFKLGRLLLTPWRMLKSLKK